MGPNAPPPAQPPAFVCASDCRTSISEMNGSLRLHEYPAEVVRLSCAKCGRSGQYRKQNLVERYGADIRLPDLREEIAHCKPTTQMLSELYFFGRRKITIGALKGAKIITRLVRLNSYEPHLRTALRAFWLGQY